MRRFSASLVAAAAFVLTTVAALAQEPAKIYGLTIPDQVGGIGHGAVIDYEAKSPGLGYGLRFVTRPPWVFDVFVYDQGVKTIPADVRSEVVRNHLVQAKGDVAELGRRGAYADIVDQGDFAVTDAGRTRFTCATFSYLRKGREEVNVDSYLCLTTWNNKFFKVRMTAPKGTMSRADATNFAKAWLPILR